MAEPKQNVDIICGSDIVPTDVKWLWYPYIPCGKITIVQGDPGEGKSTFVLALAAILTRGDPLPFTDGKREPVNVIYQNIEDDASDTVMPRFIRFGGDPEHLFFIDEKEKALTFSDDRIIYAIKELDAKVLIFDPLSGYLGADVSMNLANEVRQRFNKIINVAQQTGCAIIIISHMNKMSGAKAIYRTSGSVDVIGAARSGLTIQKHPDDPQLRVVAVYKSNLAELGKSISFSVGDTVEWMEQIDMTADELLGNIFSINDRGETKKEKAKSFLNNYLKDAPRPQSMVMENLKSAGISQRTAENAKAELGIRSFKEGAVWYWKMP